MSITNRILERILIDNLSKGINKGKLTVITPEKKTYSFIGSQKGAEAEWQIFNWKVVKSLGSRGDIGLGETYADGLWECDNLESLFKVFIDNIDDLDRYANGSNFSQLCFRFLNFVIRRNSVRGSHKNISSHYDVGNDFYKLWLDNSMTYSSAIFSNGNHDLELGQKQKYQRILNRISPDRRNILEIGCGWGGFAEHAADSNHHVTGVTISRQQHSFASERLQNKSVDIRLEDYRNVKGKFDAIASIEMFEAVGMKYWQKYFSTIKESMDSGGVAMVQTITMKDEAFDKYAKQSDYIRHYVFPGGMLPSESRFKQAANDAGLACNDVFAFGQDYAITLQQWLKRFDENTLAIKELGYNDAFIRSWRLYLSMCAASFACGRTNVIQVELQHA